MAKNNSELAGKLGSVTPVSFESSVRNWLGNNQGSNYKKLVNLWGSEAEAKRYIVMALDCVSINPEILKCDFDSFAVALLKCASSKLYPGPGHGEAALVPFKGRVTFVPMYQGIIKHALNGGFVKSIWAEVVRANDQFTHSEMTETGPVLRHQRFEGSLEQRGPRRAVYAACQTVYNSIQWYVMYPYEIEAIKNRAPAASSDFSPWQGDKRGFFGDTDWQWKKTVLKQLLKFVPKSIELARTIQFDNALEAPELDKEPTLALNLDGLFDGLSAVGSAPVVAQDAPPSPTVAPPKQLTSTELQSKFNLKTADDSPAPEAKGVEVNLKK